MSREITVAAGQLGPNTENREELIERMIGLVADGKDKGVNVIAFPEWSLSPHNFTSKVLDGPRERFFEQIPNGLTKPLFEKAKQCHIALVVPYTELDGTHFYNSAIVVNEDGEILGKYRKNHIPLTLFSTGQASYEKLYFEPGNLGCPVFTLKTANAKIGVQICYERRFPEGYRILALKGAEIVFNPSSIGTYGEKSRGSTWGRCMQSRALENRFFIVAPNKSGQERDRLSIGRSLIIECQNGDVITEGGNNGDELVCATLDLDQIAEARARRPLARDMRPDLYAELMQLYGVNAGD